MNNEQQDREEEIFLKALEIAPGTERAAWLDEACVGNSNLRLGIEELLEAHDDPPNLLASTEIGIGSALAMGAGGEQPGDRFGGRYELIEEIGRGGMGTVWLAEQDEPVRRKVALKIIKLGMDSREVVARFEAERQALAMMDHPGIAKVFDAGATEQGRLYFVMELVRGMPLTEFCDRKKLDTRARLELFGQICEAVRHAHLKGIIHRDLKPTNILVANQDGRPQPKVIDFGVAKASSQPLTEKTLFTRHGQMIGTLGYMSPEQAGGGSDVDTRSDVYSLGVLLYELLTGSTPFDARQMKEAALDEICRMVREVDPPKPSTRLSALGDRSGNVAEQRRTDPRKLGRTVRGELDWIAMKALNKDRSRRYQSAADFGGDIERYLRGEAVKAGPPSQLYRFRKFVRRHQTAFRVAAFVLLLFAAIGTTWHLGEEGRREAEANEAARLLVQVFECPIKALPSVVAEIENADPLVYGRLEPKLKKAIRDQSRPEIERLRAMLAVPTSEQFIHKNGKTWLLKVPPRDVAIVLDMLNDHAVEVREFAWNTIELQSPGTEEYLRAACILAVLAPNDDRWKRVSAPLGKWLTRQKPHRAQEWFALLQPVKHHLIAPLTQRYREGIGTEVGESAALALRHFQKDPADLVSLIRKADPQQMSMMVEALLEALDENIPALRAELNVEFQLKPDDEAYLRELQERSRLAIALFLLGDASEADWTCLGTQKDPTMRTDIIIGMSKYGVPPKFLRHKLDDESNSSALVTSLLQALGNYSVAHLTKPEREDNFKDKIGKLYTEHEDAGVHSSAEWLLGKWVMSDFREKLDEKIRAKSAEEKQNLRWYFGPEGHTMACVEDEKGSFAIATKETTVAQFKRSKIAMGYFNRKRSPHDTCPINSIPVYDAMRYCNWLSKQAGISPDDYCYENRDGRMWLRDDFANLKGFRLPSSEEFERAGLAGSTAIASFGNDPAMLKRFAWYQDNAGGVSQPVGRLMPNHFGLFDHLANLGEACHQAQEGGKLDQNFLYYGRWAAVGLIGSQ